MSTLSNIQSDFQNEILCGDTDFEKCILSTEKCDANTRIDIYKNSYQQRLIEALETDYEALHTLLGDNHFYEMALAYIEAHPSQVRSIRFFGASVSDFLKNTLPYSNNKILAEMADFEWSLTNAFDAPDATIIDMQRMEQVLPEQWNDMRFVLSPTIQQLELRCNVAEIWNAVSEEKKLPKIKQAKKSVAWIMWRKELEIFFRSMPAEEAWAIHAIQSNCSFGDICEGLCEWVDEAHVVSRAASMLKIWVVEGVVVDFTID